MERGVHPSTSFLVLLSEYIYEAKIVLLMSESRFKF
jgi:hypothetical protein